MQSKSLSIEDLTVTKLMEEIMELDQEIKRRRDGLSKEFRCYKNSCLIFPTHKQR